MSETAIAKCNRVGHLLPTASTATNILWCHRCGEPVSIVWDGVAR